MTMLTIEDLHAGYDDFLVLKGVDIAVEDGDITCIIGPNGAGKSTVFRVLYGLLSPSEGTVQFRGGDITDLSQRDLIERGVVYMLQRDAVFTDMTIKENLEMGAYAAPDEYDLEAKLEQMYDIFPLLEERASQKAGTLSGGERQMVEFARGLMLDPDLILLDEPTAGLAPRIIDDIFEKIQQINSMGVTILMIEQNVKTALEYADIAYVLEDGETRLRDDADDILDRPEIRDAYLSESVSPGGRR